MHHHHSLSLDPLWLRAAMLGSTWAAVEIVLGSFLHNIRFPFTGTILASIGTIILVAGGRIWPERGLFWRAGLICALMKSISPSSVIIGPMIGIASEALLIEAAVRIFGTNAFGLVTGGTLAALLPLVQKALSLIVTYGPDITLLYVRLVEFASQALSMEALGPLEVLLLFFGLSLVLGYAAAVSGLSVGRLVVNIPVDQALHNATSSPFAPSAVDPKQRFSLTLLGMHAGAMILGFIAIRIVPYWASLIYVVVYVLVALRLYPAVLRKLSRPRLWLEFAVVSLLAGFLLGEVRKSGSGLQWDGLIIGAEMSLRASLVVVGFSSIGVELRNPVILEWFFRRGWGELARALEVAFEALPHMISALGDQKRFFRSPIRALSWTIATGVAWLRLQQSAHVQTPHIFFVTGETGSGKTTFMAQLVEQLRAGGLSVGGILAPGFLSEAEREGFNVRDLRTGEEVPLCRKGSPPTGISAGPFSFHDRGLAFGAGAIERALDDAVQVLCIDEIGPLEIRGSGWSTLLRQALKHYRGILLLVVRTSVIDQMQQVYEVVPLASWNVSKIDPVHAAEQILATLTPSRSGH